MRQLIVLSYISLDGVIQSPGSPEEDTEGGFNYGGWIAPYDDEVSGKLMEKLLKPSDLILGRKTFEIWENYWPEHSDYWPGINEVTKYVLSHTRKKSGWSNSVFLDNVREIEKIKNGEGSDIQVWGSSEIVQLLLQHDLVDEFWLMIHPVIIGSGKKLFAQSSIPTAFSLEENIVTPTGVIIAHFKKAGKIKTGTIGG